MAPRPRHVAGNDKNARDVGLAAHPGQEIIERLRDAISRAATWGTGIEAGAPQRGAVSTLWR